VHHDNIKIWQHDHGFGQDEKRAGENKTLIVVLITAVMMVIEVAVGIISGSMALLADGLHMASHTCALGINLFAYAYARRHALNPKFSFGTGKMNALGGFTGAVLLAVFALLMTFESVKRFVYPTSIAYNQAIIVAIIGLLVNGSAVFILQSGHHHHDEDGHHHDHNLRSAYLHVLADALTSLLAIVALFSAKYWGLNWMDPFMGIIGAILVIRWSWGLLKVSTHVLLDRQASEGLRRKIQNSIESDGDSKVTDLHVWAIGPNIYSAIISVVSSRKSDPDDFKKSLPASLKLSHVTIEIYRCHDHEMVRHENKSLK